MGWDAARTMKPLSPFFFYFANYQSTSFARGTMFRPTSLAL